MRGKMLWLRLLLSLQKCSPPRQPNASSTIKQSEIAISVTNKERIGEGKQKSLDGGLNKTSRNHQGWIKFGSSDCSTWQYRILPVAGTCAADVDPGGCKVAANGGTVSWNGMHGERPPNNDLQHQQCGRHGGHQANRHLFLIDGTSCQQADLYLCLTPNASFSFNASDYLREGRLAP